MIDKQTIDRVKSALNIVDVIGEFVSLKKKDPTIMLVSVPSIPIAIPQ